MQTKNNTDIIINNKTININYMGNIDLIKTNKISVTGSRESTPEALKILENNVIKAVKKNYTIVSGYARGADETAHYTALKHNGNTIIVLPNGLNSFSVKNIYSNIWNWNNVLVISQFNNECGWLTKNAFIRNELIIDLSDIIISVHPGSKGGTFGATNYAFRQNKNIFITNTNSDGLKFYSNTIDVKDKFKLLD